jgi:hypothetical protein
MLMQSTLVTVLSGFIAVLEQVELIPPYSDYFHPPPI